MAAGGASSNGIYQSQNFQNPNGQYDQSYQNPSSQYDQNYQNQNGQYNNSGATDPYAAAPQPGSYGTRASLEIDMSASLDETSTTYQATPDFTPNTESPLTQDPLPPVEDAPFTSSYNDPRIQQYTSWAATTPFSSPPANDASYTQDTYSYSPPDGGVGATEAPPSTPEYNGVPWGQSHSHHAFFHGTDYLDALGSNYAGKQESPSNELSSPDLSSSTTPSTPASTDAFIQQAFEEDARYFSQVESNQGTVPEASPNAPYDPNQSFSSSSTNTYGAFGTQSPFGATKPSEPAQSSVPQAYLDAINASRRPPTQLDATTTTTSMGANHTQFAAASTHSEPPPARPSEGLPQAYLDAIAAATRRSSQSSGGPPGTEQSNVATEVRNATDPWGPYGQNHGGFYP